VTLDRHGESNAELLVGAKQPQRVVAIDQTEHLQLADLLGIGAHLRALSGRDFVAVLENE